MADGVSFADPRSLQNSILKDLLKVTLANHPWDGKFEVLQKYHDYPICNMWFQKDKVVFDGGTSIVRNVQVTESGNAKFTQPYAIDEPSVADVQAQLRVNWIYAQTDYSISREEMLMNRGRSKLIDLVKSKRIDALTDLANILEERAWTSPTDSSDKTHPFGIPAWITPIKTGQKYGHVGANPYYSGGTQMADCGGIDASSSTYSRWRNYADRWQAADSFASVITDKDITKIARMLRRLRFNPPQFVKDVDKGSYNNLRVYTGEEVMESLEERARNNNDQLGSDVARYAGGTVIKNIPISWMEQLDYANASTYPLYAVNHEYFRPFIMDGNFFREGEPMNTRQQHDVFTTFVDLQFNFMCTNRQRAGGIISAVIV